jgi:phage tail sheath protein FI
MPEYLAPGVYVEETSFRNKSIEGVSTTTTGFVGPTRFGPTEQEPDIITSLGEFERVYGDRLQLEFDAGSNVQHNFVWHAVRAFFEEGGKRLYVARVFRPNSTDGRARGQLPGSVSAADALQIRARFPGEAGNLHVRFTLRRGQNILVADGGTRRARGLRDRDIVWIGDILSPIASPPGTGTLYRAERDQQTNGWHFTRGAETLDLATSAALDPSGGIEIRVVTVTVSIEPTDPFGFTSVWENIPLDPEHELAGAPDSLTERFAPVLQNQAQARTIPLVITVGNNLRTGVDIAQALFAARTNAPSLEDQLNSNSSTDADRSVELILTGGDDGLRPGADEYLGTADDDTNIRTGLRAFEAIEDISIVAAPGCTAGYESGDAVRREADTTLGHLINHAQRMRYRIAVLDSGDGQAISQVRAMRGRMDSTYAALYYPWVKVLDPVTRQEVHMPPSGFVAGIYARNDIQRAVYKAPANEVVNLAIGFEQLLSKAQQEVLNPEGVNCFRFFEGRGFRLWGARTISSDPEWKYVNLRRYFAYLERSIDKGTQWAVFEPNGEALWANVRRTIEDFLLNEWQSGALLGDKPEKAYFVKCDRSTMTQNDLDNGRLICLIGVAPLRPAEFVIFRIGQWTADRKT